jgi:glycine cleavage system H protein
VELPDIGRIVRVMDPLAVVESVKSVSDVYSPVSGEVIEVNEILEANPALINEDAFGRGWIARLKMTEPSELDALMDADAYEKIITEDLHD